jgi:hypothetical protein
MQTANAISLRSETLVWLATGGCFLTAATALFLAPLAPPERLLGLCLIASAVVAQRQIRNVRARKRALPVIKPRRTCRG